MGGMAESPSFGTQFRLARERRHLTQLQVADILGVDRKTVDNWEHDRTYPRNRTGAIYEWAPELAKDSDPKEERLRAALDELREDSLIEADDVTYLMERYERRRRRGNSGVPGVAERAG